MKNIFPLFLLLAAISGSAQPVSTRFEQSNGTQTPTYTEIIGWWKMMDTRYADIKMLEMGPTDAGFPLHLVLVSGNRQFDLARLRAQKKSIILINNGIHPGEPDGIDASMLLVRDIMAGKIKLPDNVVLAIIPIYNIGGCLNRSPDYRVDQNGPEQFGFRGNARNLDLNRDFIKCDSRNARSFAEIFHLCDPDVFIDNHVSDGADYQHTMSLLTTLHEKLGGELGRYLHQDMEPGIYSLMKEKGYDLIPYVDFAGQTPEQGLLAYFDGPRYSSGYAALWQCFGFMPETHMLKSYKQRVMATYSLMQSFIEYTGAHSDSIRLLRQQARAAVTTQAEFPVSWSADRSRWDEVNFEGYASDYKPSEVSGMPRLYYDHDRPYSKQIPYFDYLKEDLRIKKPIAYIIPQGWWNVIDLLQINQVKMRRLAFDQTLRVEVYHIDDYQSAARPYEGHHPNRNVKISSETRVIKFRKGDYYIPLDQPANRFLLETLEPQAPDSYFSWNFFDAILGQKEGFSAYHFEDIAADYLKKHPDLQKQLDEKKAADSSFARNGRAQLNFIFTHSPYFEPAYLQYPVYRLMTR